MKINLFLTLTVIIFLTTWGNTQSSVVKRVEIDRLNEISIEEVVEVGENGVVLLSKGLKPEGSDFSWIIDQYSADLRLLYSQELQLPKRFILRSKFQNEKHVYFYFENFKDEYFLARVNIETNSTSTIKGSKPKEGAGKVFLINEDLVYIFYNSSKNNTCKIIDFETKADTEFFVNAARYKRDAVSIRSMSCDRDLDELVFLIEGTDQQGRHLMLASYSIKGEFKHITDIGALSSNYLYAGKVKVVGSKKYLVTGNYALNNVEAPIGLYSTMLDGFDIAFYNETPFAGLQVFGKDVRDDSESARKLRKVLEHIEVSNHASMVNDRGYYILSEFYRAEYTSSAAAGVFFGLAGAMLTYRFNGYRYEGAAMLSFDWEGNLLWEVPLELSIESRPTAKQLHVNVEESPEGFVMRHPYGRKMRTVLLSRDGKIDAQYEEDTSTADVTNFWHDEFYLSHGTFYIYTVHNENSIENRVTTKRKAYFLEKVAHH